LTLLIEAKFDLLKAEKRWLELRYYITVQHLYFEGLEGMHSEKRCCSVLEERPSSNMDGLVALKERLAWRDNDAERKEIGSSGASLLFWAAMANDVSSVGELLRTGCKFVNRGLARDVPELSMFKKTTPLIAGMAYASWEVVQLLLDSGADPMACDTEGKDALMQASVMGKNANICSWIARFPDWNLERREVKVGLTALHFAAMLGTNKRPTIELLLRSGANPLAVADNGGSLLACATINPDFLPEEMQWLLDYNSKEIRQHGLHLGNRPQTLKWRVIFSATRLLSRLGNTNKMVRELASWEGITPLHDAGRLGHHELATVLKAAGASTKTRTAQGLTPLQLAHVFHGGKVPKLLKRSTSVGPGPNFGFSLRTVSRHVPKLRLKS
jgi:ankyrin repeat protein